MNYKNIFTITAASIPFIAMGAAKGDERPNIIFLITDDQAYNTIAAHGYDQFETPNMDRLAQSGVSFMSNYATTAMSMASRASMMTGLYEYRTGCHFGRSAMSQDMFSRSYPILLREAGYFTGYAGKFGFPVDDGLNNVDYGSYDRLPDEHFDVNAVGLDQTSYETSNYFNSEIIRGYADQYPHSTRAYGAFCQDFISQAKDEDKPFCLVVGFKAPHSPMTPDEELMDTYESQLFDLPENCASAPDLLPKQVKLSTSYLGDKPNVYNYQDRTRRYHQLIHGVDVAVGMILDKLESEGLDKNTIIIFTSDNGSALTAHQFNGKILCYEETSRVPLIIVDPRTEGDATRGQRTESVTGNIDMAPTILDYAGVKIPEGLDGKSLRNLVKSPEQEAHDHICLINCNNSASVHAMAIVSDGFKYIYWGFAENMDVAEELFDLEADPFEMNNLSADKKYASRLEELRNIYDKRLELWGETCTDRHEYKIYATTIFNRHIPWSVRRKVYSEKTFSAPGRVAASTYGYAGDLLDYDAIIECRDNHPSMDFKNYSPELEGKEPAGSKPKHQPKAKNIKKREEAKELERLDKERKAKESTVAESELSDKKLQKKAERQKQRKEDR